MDPLERPKLRRVLSAREVVHEGERFAQLQDESGALDTPVLVPLSWYHHILRHFDGLTTLVEIQARILKETGQLLPNDRLESIVRDLDRALILEGPSYREFLENYRNAGVRKAAMAGKSYPPTERSLKARLGRFFSDPQGAGVAEARNGDSPSSLRGILSPHIDFDRGGLVYSWPYRELVERSDADVFVIFGVAHRLCSRRFALTYKDFETPLGLARTDRGFLDEIVAKVGPQYFEDELAHRTEHSIEFQVVFLQYLLGESRDYSIVPILVGSFHDLMKKKVDPMDDPEIKAFVEAIRETAAGSGSRVCYIGGIDLCHVGPEFGDPAPVSDATLDEIRAFDTAMLDRATAGDPAGWFRQASAVDDRWRVCGLAATYTMLQVMGPTKGRLLRYDQAVDAKRSCCVTIAGVAYDALDPVVAPLKNTLPTAEALQP